MAGGCRKGGGLGATAWPMRPCSEGSTSSLPLANRPSLPRVVLLSLPRVALLSLGRVDSRCRMHLPPSPPSHSLPGTHSTHTKFESPFDAVVSRTSLIPSASHMSVSQASVKYLAGLLSAERRLRASYCLSCWYEFMEVQPLSRRYAAPVCGLWVRGRCST